MKITRRALKLLIENYINEGSSKQEMTKNEIITKLKEMQKTMKSKGQAYIVGPGIDNEPGDPEVVAVQSLLKKLGKDIGSSGIDGDYGPATARAIKNFQKDYRELGRPDGKVGKNTIVKMIDAAKELEGGSNYQFEPAPNPYVEDEEDSREEDSREEESREEDSQEQLKKRESYREKEEVRKLVDGGKFSSTEPEKIEKIKQALDSDDFVVGLRSIRGNMSLAKSTAEDACRQNARAFGKDAKIAVRAISDDGAHFLAVAKLF